MKKLDNRFVQVMIYVFGYANIITACLASGYILIKDEDESNRRAAKIALIVSAIFTGISAILALYYNIVIGLADVSFNSGAYDAYSILTAVVNIVKIIVFAVLVIMVFVNTNSQSSTTSNTTQKAQYKEFNDDDNNDEAFESVNSNKIDKDEN